MFALYNFSFIGFDILFAKRYAFVRSNTGVRAFWKNIWKIKFSKYSQEWSCFEDLDIKNTFVQSEFNLDIHSVIYGFFLLQTSLHVANVIVLSFLYVCTCSSISMCKQSDLLGWKAVHQGWSSSLKRWRVSCRLQRHLTTPLLFLLYESSYWDLSFDKIMVVLLAI